MNFDRLSDFKSFITFVVLSAPAKFPKMGRFTGDPAADLEYAFDDLRLGVEKFKTKLAEDKHEFVQSTLDAAHRAYLDGDSKKGAHLLQDIQDVWFPGRFAAYEARKGNDV